MKHVRHLELDTTLDEFLDKRAADQEYLNEEHRTGPRFFRGVIIALPLSLSFWALVLYLAL